MQERKVILTLEAICDVADIVDYIELAFGRERADRFEKDIRQEFVSIGFMGGVFGNTHIYYRSYAIFKKSFSPSIIFYMVKEAKEEIHILRVLREERNWNKILKETKKYTYLE